MNNALNKPIKIHNFETAYAAVRDAEQRLYTDAEVLQLPAINRSHPHFKEWEIRKQSSLRLIAYLKKKKRPLKIVEIGCGNGWLSAKLAAIEGVNVLGLDANEIEIDQAKRLFKKENLQYKHSSFPAGILDGQQFDIILFAASFQYFPSVINTINNCQEYLTHNGEIHIIDTFFYDQSAIGEAAERSKKYYTGLGYPEMISHYFHHSLKDFEAFPHRIKTNPSTIWNRIFKKNPFYWVVINYTSPR